MIDFKNVTKSYKIHKFRSNSLKEKVVKSLKREQIDEIEYNSVLRNVDFRICAGDSIAILGKNGAGKSTILKLIANIIKPDSGSIKVEGNVASLLEIGAGFHPDLSGYDNVYLYGLILGLSKKQIDQIIGDIIKFSEIEKYIHEPVKNYSSGMYMRLAFSVAIHVDPDIIVIDEVLAVGDIAFQKKCIQTVKRLKGTKTIVFVSHDPKLVKEICESAIYLDGKGNINQGSVDELLREYMQI